MTEIAMSALGAGVDFDEVDPRRLAAQIRALGLRPEQLAELLDEAFERSDEAGHRLARAVAGSAASVGQFVAEGQVLFRAAVSSTPARRQRVLRGLLEAGAGGSALFVVHNMAGLTRADARATMRDYLEAGGPVDELSRWLQLAGRAVRGRRLRAQGVVGDIVDAAGDAADWVLDAIESGVDAVLEGIDAILDAATDAGVALVRVFEVALSWTVEQIADLMAALVEFGAQLGDYIAATFDWAYSAVRNFVVAALQVGFDAAALLQNAVGQSYFVLRRFVDGLFRALGDVGQVLDAALTLVEAGAALAWREMLLALRFAGADLIAVLDWMARQTQAVFTALIAAWEAIGESLITVYRWALQAGSLAWQMIGQATQDIGNSIYYVYNFLVTSGPQYLFDYTRGLLQAHLAPAELLAWAIDQAFEVLLEVLRAVLEVGTTLADTLVAMITRPLGAVQTLVQALLQLGRTLGDLLQAVFIDTARELLGEVVDALLALGQGVAEMMLATLELGGAFLGAMFSQLCSRIGTYRAMTAAERADARAVFGDSLDYDLIFLSQDDPANRIIFGLQDFFSGQPQSRAFVTSNLVNFDVGDGQIDRPTLIHELTHVWQNREIGGIYLARAIGAQLGVGYNYGYHEAAESLGIADGVRTAFAGTLRGPVTPGTVAVLYSGSPRTRVAVDDGNGSITTTTGNTLLGSVDYASGALSLSFATPPAAGTAVEVDREVDIQASAAGPRLQDQLEGFYAGTGGEAALNAAAGDLESFNVEQQGQILMHWFVRRSVPVTMRSGAPIVYDTAAWDPYQQRVAAS